MQWNIVRFPDDNYGIFLRDKIAISENGSLKLTSQKIAFGWRILRGAPSPPPIGKDNFG